MEEEPLEIKYDYDGTGNLIMRLDGWVGTMYKYSYSKSGDLIKEEEDRDYEEGRDFAVDYCKIYVYE